MSAVNAERRVEVAFHVATRHRGRKCLTAGPEPKTGRPGLPRVSKLMALAIRFDELIRTGVVADQAAVARLGYVTRETWSSFEDGHGDRQPVFCTSSGEAMATAYVRRMLPRLSALAGIEKRVHAHGLRHTHASQLREEGVDIGLISKQLGHASIATTAQYLDHIAPTLLVATIGRRRW